MTERVSDRHEDTLGGKLLPFGDGRPVDITVEIPTEFAHLASVQHTAWMLINLLCRFQGIVRLIGLICPKGVAHAGRVVPFVPANVDFASALMAGAKAIGIIPIW